MKVEILKTDHFGRGITYINNKICFVKNALANEIVDIEIVKETKKYSEAIVKEYILKSSNRVLEKCPYSNICGGCCYNNIAIDLENQIKVDKVKEIFQKYAKINLDNLEIISTKRFGYRNKITLHGNNLGYYEEKTNKLIPIEKCLLVDEKINSIIKKLKAILKNENINEVMIRTSNNSKESLIKIDGTIKNINSFISLSDVLIINDKIISSKKQIISNIGNKNYYLSADSFFQVNKYTTELLYNEILDNVKELKPKNALDLYCGVGTIGIYISDYIKKIIGIDISKSNIEDAKENSKLNNTNNISFICNKVENEIDKFTSNIDLIIVDPPRSGLDKKTINNLERINPKNIIYVSCDPLTLARDINIMSNYKMTKIKLFNMFPGTYHVESLVVLERI